MSTTRTYTDPGPCDCCGEPPVGLQCRTRGGIAALCGIPGFDVGIVPPNYYRRVDFTGSLAAEIYTPGAGCAAEELQCTLSGVYGGFCLNEFEDGDCSQTDDRGTLDCDNDYECAAPMQIQFCDISAAFVGTVADVDSDTVQTLRLLSPGSCYDNVKPTAAAGTATLSLPDTEDDAIARLIDDSDWNSWSDAESCMSRWQIRDYTDFDYEEAQFRYSVTGLAPSTSYTLTLDMEESPYDAGTFSPAGTISASFTTDGSGNATISGDVPITRGYDTRVSNPVVS